MALVDDIFDNAENDFFDNKENEDALKEFDETSSKTEKSVADDRALTQIDDNKADNEDALDQNQEGDVATVKKTNKRKKNYKRTAAKRKAQKKKKKLAKVNFNDENKPVIDKSVAVFGEEVKQEVPKNERPWERPRNYRRRTPRNERQFMDEMIMDLQAEMFCNFLEFSIFLGTHGYHMSLEDFLMMMMMRG